MSFNRPSISSNIDALKNFGRFLAKKIGISAAVWVVLYFASQPLRAPEGILPMFSFVLGSLAGGAVGWWMAEDAAETAGFSGIVLWSTLVAACVIAIVPVELLLRLITRWPANMGGWMMVSCAIVAGLGASVWRAAADA